MYIQQQIFLPAPSAGPRTLTSAWIQNHAPMLLHLWCPHAYTLPVHPRLHKGPTLYCLRLKISSLIIIREEGAAPQHLVWTSSCCRISTKSSRFSSQVGISYVIYCYTRHAGDWLEPISFCSQSAALSSRRPLRMRPSLRPPSRCHALPCICKISLPSAMVKRSWIIVSPLKRFIRM